MENEQEKIQKMIALYAKTRILTQAFQMHLVEFAESIGVKREFKQQLNITKEHCAKLKVFFDRSEKLNLEEKRTVAETHTSCSAALLETIENIAMMPEEVIDLYSKELAKFTKQFTIQAIQECHTSTS